MIGTDQTNMMQCLDNVMVKHGHSLRLNPVGPYVGESQGKIDTFLNTELI